MAEGVRPEDYCDEPAEDEFGEIIKCRSGKDVGVKTRSLLARGVLVFGLQGKNMRSLLELDDSVPQHMQRSYYTSQNAPLVFWHVNQDGAFNGKISLSSSYYHIII